MAKIIGFTAQGQEVKIERWKWLAPHYSVHGKWVVLVDNEKTEDENGDLFFDERKHALKIAKGLTHEGGIQRCVD